MSADAGLWIFLALVAGVVYVMGRAISKASMRRLEQGGTGPETVRDRKRKKADREARKDGDESAAAPAERSGGKPKRKQKGTGKKGRGRPSQEQRKKRPARPEEPEPEVEPEVETPETSKDDGLLLPMGTSLGEGLARTRKDGFIGRLGRLLGGKKAIDADLLERIEEVLFTADIGVRTSAKLLDGLRAKMSAQELSDQSKVWAYLRGEAVAILEGTTEGSSLAVEGHTGPYVVLVIGVNGAGKTTTIGKLAHRLIADGRSVMIGAGDTFRAAAVEQLGIWGRRVGAEVVEGKDGADPASVAFDTVKQAVETDVDAVLLDTAGRLHTNKNLVEELKKVSRVVDKAMPGAPHEILLVLDATNGQNAIAQAHTFGEAIGVHGIALTKLDGTAKGGVVLGIYDELKIPIRWVGVGERTQDLRPFDKQEFVDALFESQA